MKRRTALFGSPNVNDKILQEDRNLNPKWRETLQRNISGPTVVRTLFTNPS
jgi:hypothetical protein